MFEIYSRVPDLWTFVYSFKIFEEIWTIVHSMINMVYITFSKLGTEQFVASGKDPLYFKSLLFFLFFLLVENGEHMSLFYAPIFIETIGHVP